MSFRQTKEILFRLKETKNKEEEKHDHSLLVVSEGLEGLLEVVAKPGPVKRAKK